MAATTPLKLVLDELTQHGAGSMYFASVSDTYLSVSVCSDIAGEHEFLELEDEHWRDVYDALRGHDTQLVVTSGGDIRTW